MVAELGVEKVVNKRGPPGGSSRLFRKALQQRARQLLASQFRWLSARSLILRNAADGFDKAV